MDLLLLIEYIKNFFTFYIHYKIINLEIIEEYSKKKTNITSASLCMEAMLLLLKTRSELFVLNYS